MLSPVMPTERQSHVRQGFILLMLIAFTSIILGLATTFFIYCQRGSENSQVAVRIAQQRLALNAAMSYVIGRAAFYSVAPSSTVFSPATTPQSLFVMQDANIQRTKSLGWFRVAAADSTYVAANYKSAPFNVVDETQCAFITSGSGKLAGKQVTSTDSEWEDVEAWSRELRTWYLVELDATKVIAPNGVRRFIKLPGPPQTGTGAGTVFYW